jgi:hypothetical protein
MLYVDNLQHRFQTSPFCIPRCSFLALKMIQAILNEDRRGDVAGDNVEFGHLRVCFLLQSHFLFFLSFCKCHHCFFTPTMVFAILSFLLIFVFSHVAFLIYFAAEKYYGHVLWRSCGVFDSTTPPQIWPCPRCR